VRFPLSGLFIPFAAHNRSEISLRFKLMVSNSLADARNDNAVITGNPLVRSGGFKLMVFVSWADIVLNAIAKLKQAMIFFIVLDLGLYCQVKANH
jgi:hypothetical protein